MIATLAADSMTTLQWHVDAFHGVYPDSKGHTGVH